MSWKFWKKIHLQPQCNHEWVPILIHSRNEDKYSYCPLCDTMKIYTGTATLYYGPDSIMMKDEGIRLIISREVEKNSYTSNW
jgi:hypothetical protein